MSVVDDLPDPLPERPYYQVASGSYEDDDPWYEGPPAVFLNPDGLTTEEWLERDRNGASPTG